MTVDPIHQFQITNLFPVVKIDNVEIAFTNSAAFMMLAVVGLTVFLVGATAKRSLVPSRLQSAAEISYEFVASTIRSTAGSEGMKFFPFVFSIFMFVLTLNMLGLIPYAFTVTSHIIVTAALAITVFLTVLIYGLWRHGLHFFNLFVPKGVPIYILPLIVAIEILSFLSRPISRFRLLLVKWVAGVIFAAVLVLVLGGTALGFARLWFPWKGMFVFIPGTVFNVLSPDEGLKLYVWSHLLMTVNASVVLGIAFMFSCFNMKPAAATILALSLLFVNLVMEGIPFFERYHEYLLTYHFHAWHHVYSQPIAWAQMGQSLCVLAAFSLTTFLIGAAAFQARDIKS